MKRIAMWSGPRNISTAMMRSWGNRPDTVVVDEPLYAHYLASTGQLHPGGDETVKHHQTDWKDAVAEFMGPLPDGKSLQYQKQMAHHLLPHINLGWLDDIENCLLIRQPHEMLLSLSQFLAEPTLADTGLPQQRQIYELVRERTRRHPLIVDAADVLRSPREMLTSICDRLGVSFESTMLTWPPGPRDTDGVWAKVWYEKVYKTTGFGAHRPPSMPVPAKLQPLLRECTTIYQHLFNHRIRIDE